VTTIDSARPGTPDAAYASARPRQAAATRHRHRRVPGGQPALTLAPTGDQAAQTTGLPRQHDERSPTAVTQSPHPPRLKDNGTGWPNARGLYANNANHSRRGTSDRAQTWLRGAMLALAVLAVAAVAVSWDAQYILVRAVKDNTVIAALEAGIPNVGALIFAALGIALALHARRAIRARLLNVACVGISLAMNALASAPGWRDLAIWVMPSAVYALASDTLIGVVRAWVIARAHRTGLALADDEATPMAIIGGRITARRQ
jgi:hypothetical protein